MTGKIVVQMMFVACAGMASGAFATGMLPDTPLLVMSEGENSAQLGLRNTEDAPLLLYTTIVKLPDDNGPTVFALPPVVRVEPKARQVVRFILEKTPEPMKVQHLMRVRFEGIPTVPAVTEKGDNTLRMTVRQDLPVVISPKGLEQDPQPWTKLHFELADGKLIVSNPSPFVIRLSQQVDLLPELKRVKLFERTYVLPGERVTLSLPEGGDALSLTGIRLFPASPYGFDVGSYDAQLSH